MVRLDELLSCCVDLAERTARLIDSIARSQSYRVPEPPDLPRDMSFVLSEFICADLSDASALSAPMTSDLARCIASCS